MKISKLFVAAVAAAALVPAGAFAQGGGGQAGGQGQGGAGQAGSNIGQGQQMAVGTYRGIVRKVEYGQGIVQLRSEGQTVTLHGTPGALRKLNPGDSVSLQYANYGGVLWIAQGQTPSKPQSFAQLGHVNGTVTALNKSQGNITIRGQSFRAHPAELQNILPGQYVSLSYEQVNQVPWAVQIQPGQGASQQGTGGGGQGGSGNQGGGQNQ